MSIKNLLRVSALSAICLFATGCSDDDGYNADSAISNYVPEEYTKMVESVTTDLCSSTSLYRQSAEYDS